MVADYTQQSLADPASIALQQRQMELQAAQEAAALQLQQQQLAQQQWYQQAQLGQQAAQFNTTTQVNQTQDYQALQLQWAQLNQQVMEANQRLGLESQNLAFLRDKMSVDVQAANNAAQRDTQALIEQVTARMERTMTERAGLTQQAQMLQSQMQYQAAVENARNQIEADKTNEARRQFNLEQRRGVATDIANFAKDPGDVGANAAYLLAGGQAPISQAMASGADARTPQSLLPLGLLMGTQDELNRGPNLLNAPSVSAPNVPLPEFGAITPPTQGQLGTSPIQMPSTQYPAISPIPGVSPPPQPPLLSAPGAPAPAPALSPIAPAVPGAMPPATPLPGALQPPPGAPLPAAPAPYPSTGQAAPTGSIPSYLSPYGDPWSPEAQARLASGLANDSIDFYTQAEDYAQHQADLGQAGLQLAAAGDTNVEDWEQVAQEYQNRGYDIPGFAMGTPDFAAGRRPGSNAPVAIVGERGPEALLNHGAIPGGPDHGFSVIPNHALGGRMRTQQWGSRPEGAGPPGLLNALPPQANPMAMQRRGHGVPGYAEGTPDWASLMGGADPSATYGRSLGFLNDAFSQALGQSPWAGQGMAPNPVALSSPGTNPFIQEYAAALAATGSGIKPGLFQYEINQWKPQALSGQTVTRRTR